MGNTFYFDWEINLMTALQSQIGETGTAILSFFTYFGESTAILVILAFIYLVWDKKAGKYIGLNVMMCNIFVGLIKNVVVRRRPYFDNENIKCLKPVESSADIYDIEAQGFSFPSGHSTNAVAMFGSAALKFKKNWISVVAVVLPLLVGFSRVGLGNHFPTDVLAGWALGIVTIFLIPFLSQKVNKPVLYLLLVIVSSVGIFYCDTNDYFTSLGLLVGFCLADLFEERFVNFTETRKPLQAVLRVVGFVAIYLLLNTALKMPFSKEFLETDMLSAHLVRTVRYAIVAFVDMGIYPMCFKKQHKNHIE